MPIFDRINQLASRVYSGREFPHLDSAESKDLLKAFWNKRVGYLWNILIGLLLEKVSEEELAELNLQEQTEGEEPRTITKADAVRFLNPPTPDKIVNKTIIDDLVWNTLWIAEIEGLNEEQLEKLTKVRENIELIGTFSQAELAEKDRQIQNLEQVHEEFLDTQLDWYKLAKPEIWTRFAESNPSSLDVGNLINFLEAKQKIKEEEVKAKEQEFNLLKANTKQFLTQQIRLIKGVIAE